MRRCRAIICHCLALCMLGGAVSCSLRPASALAAKAAAGDMDSQYVYGLRMLVDRRGRPTSHPEKAIPWLRAAAQQGHPPAQAILGMCLLRGWGLPKDRAEAERWYRRAAESGQGGAAVELAMLALEQRNERSAVQWLELAATCGTTAPEAHMLLAMLYKKHGRARDMAFQLRAAAIGGSGEAAWLLAECYERGVGLPKDPYLSIGWRRVSAELGYVPPAAEKP